MADARTQREATWGQRPTLITTLDSIFPYRVKSFFPYLLQRIDEGIGKMPPPADFEADLNALEQVGSDEP